MDCLANGYRRARLRRVTLGRWSSLQGHLRRTAGRSTLRKGVGVRCVCVCFELRVQIFFVVFFFFFPPWLTLDFYIDFLHRTHIDKGFWRCNGAESTGFGDVEVETQWLGCCAVMVRTEGLCLAFGYMFKGCFSTDVRCLLIQGLHILERKLMCRLFIM